MAKKRKLSIEDEEEIFNDINKDFNITVSKNNTQILRNLNIDVKAKSDNQKRLISEIRDKEIIICSGIAGTGKTFISCAMALKLLKNVENGYKKIVIIKSVTPLEDESLGYLKGTLKEKMEPYIYSFIHNFEKIIGKYNLDQLRMAEIIIELPIAYLRGINIDESIVIIDECQNISIRNIHTILTRIGINSKMILLGDENQIDMKKKEQSSLKFLMDKFSNLDEIGTVILGDDDIIRNPLIKKIEKVFRENNL